MVAVPVEWRAYLGKEYDGFKAAFLRTKPETAKSFPCPRECGCEHDVVHRKASSFVAVCGCEPCNCADIPLTAEDVMLLELKTATLGRAIAKSFECDAKDVDLGLPGTKQIAAFGNAALPVVLTIQQDRASLAGAVAQLVAKLKEHFILLAPTSRFLDANSSGLLKSAKAGFFDLESNLIFLPGGKFQARKSGGELFSPFLPQNEDAVSDGEARQVFALMKSLDLGTKYRKAPLEKVFHLLVNEDKSQVFAARNCNCSEPLISLRVRQIEKKMKRSLGELKKLAARLSEMSATVEDSRARKIYHRGLTDDTGDD